MWQKPKAYLETTILSFATGRLSSNLITAAKQQFTQSWIEPFQDKYGCYVSDTVLVESLRGDSEAAQRRHALLQRFRILDVDHVAEELAAFLVKSHSIPPKAATDALHVATAAVNGMDYLVTWNCTHINTKDRGLLPVSWLSLPYYLYADGTGDEIMSTDPIVAEVRAVREQLFKECDYDLGKLVKYLHRERKRMGLKVERLEPKRFPASATGRLGRDTRNT